MAALSALFIPSRAAIRAASARLWPVGDVVNGEPRACVWLGLCDGAFSRLLRCRVGTCQPLQGACFGPSACAN